MTAPAILKCNSCTGINSWLIEATLEQILNPKNAISADIQKHGPYQNTKCMCARCDDRAYHS
jgi:hypothetical protein